MGTGGKDMFGYRPRAEHLIQLYAAIDFWGSTYTLVSGMAA